MPIESDLPRCALRGSLDPTTGIFYRAPEHTRIRTAQACDKCRVRKAKCSGDHPVCERCHTRGLLCHYAPERRARHRWSKAKAVQGQADRSTGRPRLGSPSSDASQPGRPRFKSGPSTRHADSGVTALQAGPRRAVVASAQVCFADEGTVQSESSFSRQGLDLWCGGPDRPRKDDHPVAGSRGAAPMGIEGPETAVSMVCGGKGTLEDDLDLDTPHTEGDALSLYLDPPALLDSILTLDPTGDDVSHHDLAYINAGLAGAEYTKGDGEQHPMLFHCPPRSHQSGSCFDMPSVDLSVMSNDERPSLGYASDAESPGWTPSTSSSASPVLTRASSDGLPATPTNGYPNSPFAFTSLSPHSAFVGDPNAYPLFTSGARPMDMRTDGHYHHHCGDGGMLTEYERWHEANKNGDLCSFVNMDPVF